MEDSTTPRALVILAAGAEEMETVITIDVLRRAGVEVVVAGLDGPDPVACSRCVTVTPDRPLEAVAGQAFDLVVLPGGAEGSRRLAESALVGQVLREQVAAERVVAAICAAPEALAVHGIGAGTRMTSHPSVRRAVEAHAGYVEDSVVVDGRQVTSRGPGTAFAFAFALVEMLCGAEVAAEVRAPMMFG